MTACVATNLEPAEAALAEAVREFNEECGYFFDFRYFAPHAPFLATMAEVARLRGRSDLADRINAASDSFFSAKNAAALPQARARW